MKEQDIWGYKPDQLPPFIEDGGGNSQPLGWSRRNWFLRAVETGELLVRESPAPQLPPDDRG